MTGDFSGRYIELDLNESGVLYQQGRVFLDQDGNAETRFVNRWQDTAGQDIIGSGVLGVPADDPNAFKVETAQVVGPDVEIGVDPGHAWADGLLVYLQGTAPIARTATYLGPPFENPVPTVATIGAGIRDAVILEVWREALNAFQVPNELIEPALGGPDTTERVYTAMDFRLFRMGADDTCDSIAGRIADNFGAKGKLTVSLQPAVVIPGDCPVVEGGGYTGFEHNLYRVEIAEVNAGAAMFKWSRFNGGLVGRGRFDAINGLVSITANLQPIITSDLPGFYLETREFDAALGRWRTTFGAKVTLNANNELVVVGAPLFGSFATLLDPANPIFFRLWDDIRGIGEFPVQPNPNPLLDGIRLEFDPAVVGNYQPEDFWTFSVRAGEIANPQVLINALPPEGIHYHRVPLAGLEWNAAQNITAPAEIEDCRRPFHPLTRLQGCCTFRVGDGVQSHGDFTSIQLAINALPNVGGEVCVLPGIYTENVLIQNRRNVILSGCGIRSLVRSPAPAAPATAAPVIHVRNSANIRIEDLGIQADDTGVGVLLEGGAQVAGRDGVPAQFGRLQNIELDDLVIQAAQRSGIEGHVGRFISITNCKIEMKDQFSPWPGIFLIGDDCLIERNEIRVLPGPRIQLSNASQAASAGRGGIQIGGTSERVRIINNLIQTGIGNGITLGHILFVNANGQPGEPGGWGIDVNDPCDPCRPGDNGVDDGGGGDEGSRRISGGALDEILIERNRIFDMGMNGIGVAGFFNLIRADEFITVRRLTVIGNDIRRCLNRQIAQIPQVMLGAMGYGGISLADVEMLAIRDNFIEQNGRNHLDPVCGIYVLHGEGIEISRNRILNNGAKTQEPAENARDGARAGIYIEFALAPTVPFTFREVTLPGPGGPPAAVVQNNVVSQPLGQALRMVALGPVSATNNELMTHESLFRVRPLSSFIATTVFLVNLGVGPELLGLLPLVSKAAPVDPPSPRPGLDDERILRKLVNGTIQFSDNQVTLELLERGQALVLSSVLIFTLDDVGFHDNQCYCDLTDDFVISNVIILSATLRVLGNRFAEGLFNALLSAITLGMLMNITAHNQATHCLVIRPFPPPTIDSPNMVFFALNNQEGCNFTRRILPTFGK